MYYTLSQWLLIFFIYCFLGWIWECSYVSISRKEWVNRGFLHGPVIPIYGSGAIIILWLTLPFEKSIPLIYILGLLGASILEYATGASMEKLFHMRYWDYSHHKFNLNGNISLFVSFVWGIFSVLLVKVLHPPINNAILLIPSYAAEPISLILTVAFVVDTTISIQSALDMKELLHQITENNKLISFVELKLNEITSNISQTSNEFQKHLQRIGVDIKENTHSYQSKIEIQKESNKAFQFERIKKRKYSKLRFLALLSEKVDTIIKEIQVKINSDFFKAEKVQLSQILKELNELKSVLKKAEISIASRKDKVYKKAANLIRRNPNSVSMRFKEAMSEIKSFNKSNNLKKKK